MNHCAIATANADSPTWSPACRLECEARHLLTMPLEMRQAELAHANRAKRRSMLEQEMLRIWPERKRQA